MKILLDTCTFLWTFLEDEKLSGKVRYLISDPENEVFVTTTSLWEIAIKHSLNKLDLGMVNVLHLPNIAQQMDFQIINPETYDYVTYGELPLKENHRDPFDRMIIHTALRNHLTLLSCDEKFQQYEENGLELVW